MCRGCRHGPTDLRRATTGAYDKSSLRELPLFDLYRSIGTMKTCCGTDHKKAPALSLRISCVLCLIYCFTTNVGAADGIGQVSVLTPSVRQYERVVISVAPDREPSNPFDPNEVSFDALITLPSDQSVKVPGFWYQQYQRSLQDTQAQGIDRKEKLEKVGQPEWLESRDNSGLHRSEELSFDVTVGQGSGFVRVSPRNQQYLEYDSGSPFFPIGLNLCMYQKREGTYYYDRLLAKLQRAGGNYVRLWQEYYVPRDLTQVARPGDGSFTGFPLETVATGLGRYDLESAWRLDYVADLCQSLDIYWQITFEMTVWWQQRMAYRWGRNPYNSENGGPCSLPSEYFTNSTARELVRRSLRYSVGRWGWASNLVAWELWNEVDNNDGFDSADCADWHREMAEYLRSIDPWQHLITTSWRDPQMFALPQIDIVQGHSYFGPMYDAAQYSMQDTEHLMRDFNKPFFFGEQGIAGPVDVDPEGKHFHDTIWATALSGAAGTGLYWWCHNYVERYNLYDHYSSFAKFVAGVDWPGHRWKVIKLSRPNLPVSLNVYGLVAEDRALIWVHDPLAFRVVDGKPVRGPRQRSSSCNVIGLADGRYEVNWYDTSTGEIIGRENVSVNHLDHFGYGIELKPPEFWGDIAARVIRHGQSW